ncbi:MAG: sigma-70 family RNA polymerase sigma factor [Clostridia bacterium]|nr:sigma-70 family RNA polymerase sigma factor [Clostridia bacterium]
MKTNSGNRQFFYPVRDAQDPYKVHLEPIPEHIYHRIMPDIWKTQKRMQRSCRCTCPKAMLRTCDADCDFCPYRVADSMLSFDAPVEDAEDLTIGEMLVDVTPSPEYILMNKELIEALYDELEKLDPDSRRICELIMQGKSEREIAADMGKRQSTINYRKNKVFFILREALKDYI